MIMLYGFSIDRKESQKCSEKTRRALHSFVLLSVFLFSPQSPFMYRSIGEYTAFCKETFDFFLKVEKVLERLDGKPLLNPALSPYGVQCAFTVITGYNLPTSQQGSSLRAPSVALSEQRFLDWMHAFAGADESLVAFDESDPSQTAHSASSSHSFSVWSLYESIAGTQGYLTPQNLFMAECHSSFEDAMDVLLDTNDVLRRIRPLRKKEKRPRECYGSTANVLFHRLDSKGNGKVTFSDVKSAFVLQ